MSTKILLIRVLDPSKYAQLVSVLSTVASLKEESNCYLIVTRACVKLKIGKNEANLCELSVQFRSIFFDDYKYIQGDYSGHAFLLNGIEQLADALESFRGTVR